MDGERDRFADSKAPAAFARRRMRTGDLAQTRVPLRVLLAAARRDLRLTITCLVDRTELSFWDRIVSCTLSINVSC